MKSTPPLACDFAERQQSATEGSVSSPELAVMLWLGPFNLLLWLDMVSKKIRNTGRSLRGISGQSPSLTLDVKPGALNEQ